MTIMEPVGGALTIPEPATLAVVLRSPEQVDALIGRIEAEVRSHAPDTSTVKGRDAIKSLAYKVARTKTAIDDAGKALNEDARRQINAVDAGRKVIRDRLDALRDEARAPLEAWEAAEEDRVNTLKMRMDFLDGSYPDAHCQSDHIRSVLAGIEAIAIGDDWQEYQGEAGIAKDKAVRALRASLEIAEKREADAAEIEALRREKAARDEADRIAAEAAAEAERQRIAAEEAEARRVAAEKAEAERQARIEEEKREAAERAAKEAEERARAEAARQAREAEERVDAERRAAAARESALQRQIEEQRAATERAAQAERDRAAAERRAEEEARQRREADKSRRVRVRGQIIDALRLVDPGENPMGAIADALMAGAIPNVRVEF